VTSKFSAIAYGAPQFSVVNYGRRPNSPGISDVISGGVESLTYGPRTTCPEPQLRQGSRAKRARCCRYLAERTDKWRACSVRVINAGAACGKQRPGQSIGAVSGLAGHLRGDECTQGAVRCVRARQPGTSGMQRASVVAVPSLRTQAGQQLVRHAITPSQ
jgi:hypothetical protein